MEKKEIVINPKAPDEHWVSPSGSDTWCTVGQLKGLIAEVCRLSHEVVRLRAMVELDCTQPGVCPVEVERDKYKAALERIASGEIGAGPFPHRDLERACMISIAAEAVQP